MTSKLTRERIEQYANDPRMCNINDEIRELARMALAAIDNEPVYQVYGNNDDTWSDVDEEEMIRCRSIGEDTRTLYSAPPMPVVDSELVAVVEPSDYVTAAQLVGEGPARKAVHELYEGALRIGDKLYRHAQPAPVVPVVPDEKPMPNPLSMYAVDAVAAIAEVKGWNACRAAMLQEYRITAGVSNNCRSNENVQVLQAGNSPVIGIDLASSPDRTAEVRYVAPPGYVMVPKEPTAEMIAAAMNCDDVEFNSDETFCVNFDNIYTAMIAAAPQEVKGE